MEYEIRFVADDVMPQGHDFMLLATDDRVVILYRQAAISPAVLEDSWAAFRALMRPRLALAV